MIKFIKHKFSSLLTLYYKKYNKEHIGDFAFESSDKSKITKDIINKYNMDNDLAKIFINNKDWIVHKWHHYIPIYEKYFSNFRGKKIKFLEIGVGQGGSLQMWSNYFGKGSTIFGIDINPECLKYSTKTTKIRIGSQVDKVFLKSVIAEMGGVDIILDDGSHHMKHISKTLKILFPSLNYKGIYMIEDLHTSYWKRFGGGYNSKNNFFSFAAEIVDDMHHWYHHKKLNNPMISKDCSGLHIHDSIIVLEKNKTFRPVHSKIS